MNVKSMGDEKERKSGASSQSDSFSIGLLC